MTPPAKRPFAEDISRNNHGAFAFPFFFFPARNEQHEARTRDQVPGSTFACRHFPTFTVLPRYATRGPWVLGGWMRIQ